MRNEIIPFKTEHWSKVRSIYQGGIDTGLATFEIQAPDWEIWDQKFLKDCRIVCVSKSEILGWAALQPVSNRKVYRGVAEVSVYVDLTKTGLGIGNMLLESLITESEKNGFWMLTVSIFKENKVSIYLHEKMGFQIMGVRERIAKRDGIWIDTVLMDRRSEKIG